MEGGGDGRGVGLADCVGKEDCVGDEDKAVEGAKEYSPLEILCRIDSSLV